MQNVRIWTKEFVLKWSLFVSFFPREPTFFARKLANFAQKTNPREKVIYIFEKYMIYYLFKNYFAV